MRGCQNSKLAAKNPVTVLLPMGLGGLLQLAATTSITSAVYFQG